MRRISFDEIEGLSRIIARRAKEYWVPAGANPDDVPAEEIPPLDEEEEGEWMLKEYDENNPDTYEEEIFVAPDNGVFSKEHPKHNFMVERYIALLEVDSAFRPRISIWNDNNRFFYTDENISGPKRIKYEEGLI